MAMILLTGAEGKVGRALFKSFYSAGHHIISVDRKTGCLLSKDTLGPYSWYPIDVVVHLAANPNAEARWEDVVQDNITLMHTMLDWSVTNRVPKVIFASSNWTVRAPTEPYGLSKLIGELMGETFVRASHLQTFIAVRIGSFQQTIPNDPLWIGEHDLQSLFRRCVETDVKGFHVVYGVSAQTSSTIDLSYTKELLGWEPKELQQWTI